MQPPDPIHDAPISPQSGRAAGTVAALALALVISMPFATLFAFGTSSPMLGLVAACAIIIVMGIFGFYKMSGGRYWTITLTTILAALLVTIMHGMIASLVLKGDALRAAGALVAAVGVATTAYLVRLILLQTPSETLDRVMTGISVAFVVVGILSILGIQPLPSVYAKPIFPFTEPSHFALSFTPFLIYRSVRSSLPVRIIWLATAMLLALLLQSLSLVVAVCLAAACCLSFPMLALALIGLSITVSYLDISYFTDRLDFSVNTTNVSTLVYIQGLELIEASMQTTWGLGIGFQQLGIVALNVPTSDLIYRINGNDANLHDGGFTAAKLIAELGVVGFVVAGIYAYALVKAVRGLRVISAKGTSNAHQLFSLSVIAGLSIELFVRGAGYFTGTILIAGSAVLMAVEGGYLKIRRPVAQDSSK